MSEIEITGARIATNNVKRLLRERNMSQEDVARRIQVSYRHFNRIVLGDTDPTLLVAAKISTVFGGIPIEDIFEVKVRSRKARAA